MPVTHTRKRDGRIVPFDLSKIEAAISKAFAAVGEGSLVEARSLSAEIVQRLELTTGSDPPTVEGIQDLVEEILMERGYMRTAKAYVIYRRQHQEIREVKSLIDATHLLDGYLNMLDWKVNENSNMSYSLQGLNNYATSALTAKYWLEKIYPPEVRFPHADGDFHIHDLGALAPYCVGWDLRDLFTLGFGGVTGKVASRPPKHLRSALGHIINFFYTLQGEAAGAQAFANFDTYLAPFVRYDDLDYKGVKQAIQEFVFNVNIPTRVGFQCVSEDTEILTPDGWVGYNDIQVGQIIKTFNTETGEIEDLPVTKMFSTYYEGEMYNLKNRIQDQLISLKHRVVRKKFNTDQVYVLEEIEKVSKYKSPVILPITGKNRNPHKEISDDTIKLLAWIIADGTKESSTKNRHCNRITIYQSQQANPEKYEEIIGILDRGNFEYSVRDSTPSLGKPTKMIRLNAASSHSILDALFKTRETIGFIPDVLKNMSKAQARLFLETYIRADGHEGCKITTTDIGLLNGLQQLAVDAEYGFTVRVQEPTIGEKPLYKLRLIDHQDTYIQRIEKVNYSGMIWCPTTDNGTIIAKRNGKVFITGNSPFTNLTLDLVPPSTLREEAVVVGGELKDATYGEFQKEMDVINRAFAEVMLEGDAKARPFSFPIPTYNITRDFDWDNPVNDGIFQMTAKYGIPYYSNFINSDMDPEDARSMCCRLRLDNRELRIRGGGLFGSHPLTGSIGVVTLNMPRIGYVSRSREEFLDRTGHLMDLAKESLEIKRKVLERFTESNLYPYTKVYLQAVRQHTGAYWTNHFSTIGLTGMNEALLNLLGVNIASPEGKAFALEVMHFMRKRLARYQQETNTLYNLEATPAEGTSTRLAKLDIEKYPDIITAGNDVPYYTNSTHLPVGATDDLFEALQHQDDLQVCYTGGTVFHAFIGEMIDDYHICKRLVRKIAENFRLPYYTISPTFSICPVHGYIKGKHFECPVEV